MPYPTIILAHGAWHTPESFQKIVPKLEANGFTCKTVAFPSVVQDPPVQDMKADIQTVRDAVLEQSEAGNDVVIVSHSWSGAPVNSALDGLSKQERSISGKAGGVIKLVFIAAFLVPEGVSVFDALGQQIPVLWDVQGDRTYANDPVHYFYNDLSPEEAKFYASLLKPHAKATKFSKTTGAAWKKIPSCYLICEDDNAIPSFAQEGMIKTVQDGGGNITSERIKSSHSPFLSKPDEVVQFIMKSVGNQ